MTKDIKIQVGPHFLSVSTAGHLDSGPALTGGRNKVENKSIRQET